MSGLILFRLPTDFKDFWILLIGRLLGGIATSLLFSIFEAWLIRAHADSKLKNWLSKSFTWAAYGNSIIAIAAGLVANHAAEGSDMRPVLKDYFYVGGYLEPFDIALVMSCACCLAAMQLWEENYGDGDDDDDDIIRSLGQQQQQQFRTIDVTHHYHHHHQKYHHD